MSLTIATSTCTAGGIVAAVYLALSRWKWQKLLEEPVAPCTTGADAQRRVVIIGSGVSGLIAAKTFLQYGYSNVVILESSDQLGGVWNCNYVGAATQGPFWFYQIPEFPWPSSLRKGLISPNQTQIKSYLSLYAAKFGVDKLIRYSHKVLSVTRNERCRLWKICLEGRDLIEADVLVVATGNNHQSHASIPDIPNLQDFKGNTMHSSEVVDSKLLEDANKIVVVGGSKSAYDIAVQRPHETTLVMRTPHFFTPRWLILPPFIDRLMFYMMRGYHPKIEERSCMYRFLDWALGIFAFSPSKPTNRTFVEDLIHGGGAHVTSTHEERVKARHLTVEASQPVQYTANGIELSNGHHVEADVVVWGTGFHPSRFLQSLFPDIQLQDNDTREDGLYLYKYILHPMLPDCYFVGFKDLSFTSCVTSSGEALWAAFCASGKVNLPSPKEIQEELMQRKAETRRNFPRSHRRAHYDYFGTQVGCDYSFVRDLVSDCGLENRVAHFGCHHLNPMSSGMDFEAIFGAKSTGDSSVVNVINQSSPLVTRQRNQQNTTVEVNSRRF